MRQLQDARRGSRVPGRPATSPSKREPPDLVADRASSRVFDNVLANAVH
jgi:hypothetical protein